MRRPLLGAASIRFAIPRSSTSSVLRGWTSTSREPHVYAADWQEGRVDFLVDGARVKTVEQAPAYPMQMMVAVFDFPEKDPTLEHVPELAVDWIRGSG